MDELDDTEQIEVIPLEIELVVSEDNQEETISYKKSLKTSCEVCGDSFTSRLSLEDHQKFCQKKEASQKSHKSSDLKSFIKFVHGKKLFFCEFCEYQTNKKFNFKKHLAVHADGSEFKCELCDAAFSKQRKLTMHKQTQHSELELFKCKTCASSYESSSSLQKHMLTHSEDIYKCDVCDKAFSDSSNLTRHQRIHDEETHKCSKCPFATNTKGNLQVHMKAKHSEKTLTCEKCDYTTADRSNMKKHQLRHLDVKPKLYNCELCDFQSPYKHNVTQHMSRHMEFKPYCCSLCEFSTTRPAHLKRHMECVHLKKKLYSCSLCEFKTSDKSHLIRHVKCVHKCQMQEDPPAISPEGS